MLESYTIPNKDVSNNIAISDSPVLSKRFDVFKIPKVAKTKEGYLRGEVIASRAGVFEYLNFDGSVRRELRHPDEVFKRDSLDTIKMIPVTDDHPTEFVDSKNVAQLQVGYTGENCHTDGDNIIVTVTITHQDVIDKILSGKKVELSLGYELTLLKKSGNYDSQDYDYIQTNIVYNHLAVVNRGRAGRNARFRFDNAAELNTINNNLEKVNMSEDNQNLDTRNLDQEIENKKLRIDALIAEKVLLTSQLEEKTRKLDHVEKAWEKTRKELEEEKKIRADNIISEKVMDRVALFAQSMPFLKDDLFGYLRHSDREIMVAVLNSNKKEAMNFDGQTDEYIKGMFDAFVGTNLKTSNIDTKSVFSVLSKECDVSTTLTTHDKIMKQMKAGK